MPDRARDFSAIRTPFNPVLSDALALLNRNRIVLDQSGCFEEGQNRICLVVRNGAVSATVDGHPVEWCLLAPHIKPRRFRRQRGER